MASGVAYCTFCGSTNSPGYKYCGGCGKGREHEVAGTAQQHLVDSLRGGGSRILVKGHADRE